MHQDIKFFHLTLVSAVGRLFLNLLMRIGRIVNFAACGIFYLFRPPFYFKLLLRQMMEIGYGSLLVVGLTAIFTGMVLALQSYIGFARFAAESAVPQVSVVSITRELGPVLAGLMVAGRVSAAMAAEIGTMRVTEQIDALRTLSTNVYAYLIVPRLLAATICLPLLVVVADTIGIWGGYLVATGKLGFSPDSYIETAVDFVAWIDIFSGLIKAACFGFILALMGCYHGFNCRGGARGVGRATRNAVVSASIAILASNYLLTELFFSIG